MATLVCFHAHPDDEAITTGGLMTLAARAGHRVVLVCATKGERGEPQPGVLDEGEALWQRRVVELTRSTEILGADAPRFLGYEDSGMMGEPTNDNPACFWQADHDEAVARLVEVLREFDADVLTIYDDHGGYGHPDHLRVHTVGLAAAGELGLEHVYEATINRDLVREMMAQSADPDSDVDIEGAEVDVETFGTAAADISYELDVSSVVFSKREAIAAHRSQVGPDDFFLSMPDEMFAIAFGLEWFNRPGVSGTGGPERVSSLPGLNLDA